MKHAPLPRGNAIPIGQVSRTKRQDYRLETQTLANRSAARYLRFAASNFGQCGRPRETERERERVYAERATRVLEFGPRKRQAVINSHGRESLITFSTLSTRCLNPVATTTRPSSIARTLSLSRSLRNCPCSCRQAAARAKKLAKKLRGEDRRRRTRRDNGLQPGRFC